MKESIICRIFGANGDIGILDRINEQLINEANNKTMESILKTENINFGLAIEALKLGKLVARKGWNGKNLFICKQVPAIIDSTIIPKMQSLPKAAKVELLKKNMEPIEYRNQMLIVNTSGDGNKIADSWVPSSSDIFAEDWFILE